MKNTFTKAERISIQREIDLLFAEGQSFMAYPLRVIHFRKKPYSGVVCSILISVPKKRLKHAVDRNYIKRLIREAYRTNKHSFVEQIQDTGFLIAFVYVGNQTPSYSDIEKAVKKALNTVCKSKLQITNYDA